MATKKDTAAKKAAPAKKAAATTKTVATKKTPPAAKRVPAVKPAKKTTTPAKKITPAKKAVASKKIRSRSRAEPTVGILCERGGELGICSGDDFCPLSTLAAGGDAVLTLTVELGGKEFALAEQSESLRTLTLLLAHFLNKRAVGNLLMDATCGQNTNTSGKDGDY